jgi:hypothetical protein
MLQRLFAAGLLAVALVMPVRALAQVKVSGLPAASALAGTEVAPVVQSGATVKATVDQYAARARTVITGQANTWTGAQSMNTPLAVTSGGTGSATVPAALVSLGAAPGRAVLSPKLVQTTVQSDAWNAFDPWGRAIDCSGTTSQCLQEFITATAANGWPAEVHCQGRISPRSRSRCS